MATYHIRANEVQQTYSDLLVLSSYAQKINPETNLDPQVIEANDTELFRLNTGKPYAVRLYSETGQSETTDDTKTLDTVLQELYKLDAGGDQRIDKKHLNKDVAVELSAPINLTSTLSEIAAIISPSVFAILPSTDKPSKRYSAGTASVSECLPQSDGTYLIRLLTNAHITAGPDRNLTGYQIFNNNDVLVTSEITLVGSDPLTDVGVLEFVSTTPYRVVADLNNTAKATPGQSLIIVGNTLTTGVTAQVVTVKNVEVNYYSYVMSLHENYPFDSYYILGDARGGNSGSLIVNQDLQFVALLFGGTKIEDGQNQYWEGGTATAERVKISYQNILDHRDTHGVVFADWGISVQAFMESDAFWQNHPLLNHKGVIVGKTAADGPAEKAGLLDGDVIVSATTGVVTTEFDIHSEEKIYPFLSYVLDSDTSKPYTLNVYRPRDKSFHTLTITPSERTYLPPEYFTTEQGFGVQGAHRTTIIYHDDFLAAHSGIVFENPDNLRFGANQMTYNKMLVTEINGIPTPDVKSFQTEYDHCKQTGQAFTLTLISTPMSYKVNNETRLSYTESDGGTGITYYETFRFY